MQAIALRRPARGRFHIPLLPSPRALAAGPDTRELRVTVAGSPMFDPRGPTYRTALPAIRRPAVCRWIVLPSAVGWRTGASILRRPEPSGGTQRLPPTPACPAPAHRPSPCKAAPPETKKPRRSAVPWCSGEINVSPRNRYMVPRGDSNFTTGIASGQPVAKLPPKLPPGRHDACSQPRVLTCAPRALPPL